MVKTASVEQLFSIRQLTKSLPNEDQILMPIVNVPAFDLAAKEQCFLEGGSGSGKTTLLHLIAGIIRPDSGSMTMLGKDVFSMKESQRDQWRAQHIGYIFQSFNLLQGYSVLDNILIAMSFGGGIDRDVAMRLIEAVGLSSYQHRLPRQLSIGQQQRVAVARALANRPSLILADEPTGNLDSTNAKSVMVLIHELSREYGAALLMVSHDLQLKNNFNRVISMTELNQIRHS